MCFRCVIAFALCVVAAGCRSTAELSPKVTRASIRQIKLGNAQATVTELLGAPRERKDMSDGWITLVYSRPAAGSATYPMLWVTLHNDAVTEVYAKRYVLWGADDDGVYLLNERNPQGWVSPDFDGAFPDFPREKTSTHAFQ